MNERIKELLAQAGVGDNWNKADWYSMSPAMVEKFAQLIAEDCAAYADEMWPHQKEFKGTLNISQGIRRKFEVPE